MFVFFLLTLAFAQFNFQEEGGYHFVSGGTVSERQTQYEISRKRPNITVKWRYDSNSSITPTYLLLGVSSDQSILNNISFSLPFSGLITDDEVEWTIFFNCETFGDTKPTLIIVLNDPSFTVPEVYQFTVQKECRPPSCDGMCGTHGACVDGDCVCDYGWNTTFYCERAFYTNLTEVCVGQDFELIWDTDNETAVTDFDWWSMARPLAEVGWDWNATFLSDNFVGVSGLQYQWSYMNGDDSGGMPIPSGVFILKFFEDIPGFWPLIFYANDQYIQIGLWTVLLLPSSDPRCEQYINGLPGTCVEDQGVWNVTESRCDCVEGFFGPRCEYGCPVHTELTSYGQDFGSSIQAQGYYTNFMNCSWEIKPSKFYMAGEEIEVNGIEFFLYDLSSEANKDTLTIYNGTEGTEYSGAARDLRFSIPGTEAAVQWVSDYTTCSLFSKYAGFVAGYRFLGCPKGGYVLHNETLREWDCLPCPANHFSMRVDSDVCAECGDISQSEVNMLSDNERDRYNAVCVPRVAYWRKVVAVVAIIWMVIVHGGSLILIPLRHKFNPLLTRSATLLFVYSAASFIFLSIPLMDLIAPLYDCRSVFWLASLRMHFCVLPILFMVYRLKLMLDFQSARKEAATLLQAIEVKDEKQSAEKAHARAMDKVTKRVGRSLRQVKFYSKPPLLVLGCIFSLIPAFAVILLNWSFENRSFPATETIDSKGCYDNQRQKLTDLGFFILYVLLFAFVLYKVRGAHDGFGMKLDISRFLVYYSFLSILYYIVSLSAVFDLYFNFRYCLWFIVAIFQFRSILLPCLNTFPAFVNSFSRSLNQEFYETAGRNLNLEEILASSRGRDFFLEHCRREFSEENVLCYLDIEEFRKTTNKSHFIQIYTKYILSTSPFSVNVSGKVVTEIEQAYNERDSTALSDLQQVFNNLRQELLALMSADTFRRFVAGDLFSRYIRGDKLRTTEESNLLHSHSRSELLDHSHSRHHVSLDHMSGGGGGAGVVIGVEQLSPTHGGSAARGPGAHGAGSAEPSVTVGGAGGGELLEVMTLAGDDGSRNNSRRPSLELAVQG